MRKALLLIVVMFAAWPLLGQTVEGTWNGQLAVGQQKLRLVFHFAVQDSLYTGTMDSPDQGAKGIELTSVAFDAPELAFAIAQLGVSYKGTLQEDGTIQGTFTQMGQSFPLPLTRGEVVLVRPQEPTPPYLYDTEEVRFASRTTGVELAGTLTTPRGVLGKYPAVVLVSGSGAQNRDEEIAGHKPFLVLADHLTRAGIAVLRYDDRGVEGSSGDFVAATTADFTADALGAVDFLASHPEIDPAKVGIIGHSEGGTVAFMAAAESPEVAFVVSLAGMSVRGDSLLVRQNRDLMLAQGLPEAAVVTYCEALARVFTILETHPHSYIAQNIGSLSKEIISEEDAATVPAQLLQNLVNILITPATPWMSYFLTLDPAEYIRRVECPVLAVNGNRDLQVNAVINLAAIADNLTAAGNHRYTVRELEELNHLFQHSDTGLPTEYPQIEETLAPELIATITDWILAME
jgi:pimeloyl-ACP methyl ester carboxylesterase